MEIVSLLPSATEIVYELGLQDSLKGVTAECDHPEGATSKPVISRPSLSLQGAVPGEVDAAVSSAVGAGGSLYVLDEALIRAIQPDLILAQDLCRVCAIPSGKVTDALDRLGCVAKVVSLDPNTIDEVIEGIARVAEAAHVYARGHRLVLRLRERVQAVRRKTLDLERVPTLFLEWPDPPFGGGHWVPEMVDVAGGRDIVGRAGAPSRRVTWDEIEEGRPELAVYSPCGFGLDEAAAQAPRLFDVPQFAATPAARAGRVFAVDATSYFSRPGPRIVDGIEILASILHPGELEAPTPGSVVRVQR